MNLASDPVIAVVLPPNEGFGPGQSGAIGLIAHRLADLPGFRTVVFCGLQRGPAYPHVDRRPVSPARWLPGTMNLRYAARMVLPLRRLRPAVVEVHNRVGIALGLSVLLRPTPVVLVLHNDPQAMRHARTAVERERLLARVARVVTVSDFIRGRLLDGVGDPARPPMVIPNALDLTTIPASSDPGSTGREKLILFAGRMVAEKGPDLFVAACAAALPQLPEWRAEMIGADRSREDSPDTPFVARLRAAAQAAGVTLTGYRDHPQVLAAMSRASLVVVPSRWPEPFGLVALEAMACGAALICTRQGGLPEVGGEAAVFIDAEDPAELTEAILSVASDDPRRASLAEAGLSRAARFDISVARRGWAVMRQAVIAGAR